MTKPIKLQEFPNLEQEIEKTLQVTHHTPMPVTTPLISTRLRDLDDLGRMSAEAVLTQYDATAQAVEAMGNDVKDMVKRLGEKLIECDADLKMVAETAAAIREKGKHSQALIEQISSLSLAIREACTEFKKKVGA